MDGGYFETPDYVRAEERREETAGLDYEEHRERVTAEDEEWGDDEWEEAEDDDE